MNTFDAVVTAFAVLAVVLGFMSGLLRSLATILAYLVAAPIAIAITERIVAETGQFTIPADQAWQVLVGAFIALGILFGALARGAINEFVGPEPTLFDRIAGAALGGVRIFLLAVLIALVFDRLIPPERTPPFLAGSKLRPYLSAAGQQGLRALPPDVEAYIDRVKRERGL